jgi:hypothetical protein
MTQNHKTKHCFLRQEPEAAAVVGSVDDRIQKYRLEKQAAPKQHNGAGPGRKIYKGGHKFVRFK